MLPNLVQCRIFRFPTMPYFIPFRFFLRRNQTAGSIDWHAAMWLRERIFAWCINEIDLIRAKASLAISSVCLLALPPQSRRRHLFILHRTHSCSVFLYAARFRMHERSDAHMLFHNPTLTHSHRPSSRCWRARRIIAGVRAASQVQVKSLLFLSLQAKSAVCQTHFRMTTTVTS